MRAAFLFLLPFASPGFAGNPAVVLKNGERLEASRIEEAGANVVLHFDRGEVTLPRSSVASIEAGTPAPPPARAPDRIRIRGGATLEGVVTAEEKDLLRVRVRGGELEIGRNLVEGVQRGGLSAQDLLAADAADRAIELQAESVRQAEMARLAAEVASAARAPRGEAVPAAVGAEAVAPSPAAPAYADDLVFRLNAIRAVEEALATHSYPERLFTRQAILQELFPGYLPPTYSPVLHVWRPAGR